MIISGYTDTNTEEKNASQEEQQTWVLHGQKSEKPNSELNEESSKKTYTDVQREQLEKNTSTVNESFKIKNQKNPDKHQVVHTQEDIQSWDFLEALQSDPLYKRHGRDRALKASKTLFKSLKPTGGFLKPGQVAYFIYDNPKTKDDLEWWDNTPCTIFFGYVKTKEGLVRELGFNLHYYPPYIRKKILERIFLMFKKYFLQNFDNPAKAKLSAISYQRLVGSLRSAKLDFGLKEYIPGLRRNTRLVPTKFLPTACLTEGNFSRATAEQIFQHWKQFKP